MSRSYYIIAGGPRTGSTLLCRHCKNNGLGSPGEHFKTAEHNLAFSRAIARGESTEVFARRVLEENPGPVFGTKIMWPWLESMVESSEMCPSSPHALFNSLFPGVKYIFITRRDRLAQAISLLRATHTQQWIRCGNDGTAQNTKWPEQAIPPQNLHETILAQVRFDYYWRRMFRESGADVIEISYEELTSDPNSVMKKVGRAIVGEGFSLQTVETDLLVQRDDRTNEICREYFSYPLSC